MNLYLHKEFFKSFSLLNNLDKNRVLETIKKMNYRNELKSLRVHNVGEYSSYSVSMKLRILCWENKDKKVLVYVNQHDDCYRWGNRNKSVCIDDNLLGFIDTSMMIDHDLSDVNKNIYSLRINEVDKKLIRNIREIAPEYYELINNNKYNDYKYEENKLPSNIIEVKNDIELEKALSLPFEEWMLFLHPSQSYIIDIPNNQNLIILGGPGTGKTITLIHKFLKIYESDKDIAFFTINDVTKNIIGEHIKKLNPSIDVDKHIIDIRKLDYRKEDKITEFLNSFSIIFIDEAQDMPLGFLSKVISLYENKKIISFFIIACDLNQSIISPSGEGIKRMQDISNVVVMDFSYRFTKQIANYSLNVLNRLHNNYEGKNFQEHHKLLSSQDEFTSSYISNLDGTEVISRKINNENIKLQIDDYMKKIVEKHGNNMSEYAIIIIGHIQDDLSEYLKSKYELLTAKDSKGREFKAGIVLELNHFELKKGKDDKYIISQSIYKSLSETYVALTRFRNEVLCLYLDDNSVLNIMEE